MDTSNRTIKWIENLAEQELLISAGERTSIDICTTKDEVLSVESSTFLRELFHHFSYLVKLFNLRVSQDLLKIEVKKEEGGETFNLSRNGLKLIVGRSRTAMVQLSCVRVGSREQKPTVMFSGVVEAKFGAFHDVEWHFLGSAITGEQLARHYLTEFIQGSRVSS